MNHHSTTASSAPAGGRGMVTLVILGFILVLLASACGSATDNGAEQISEADTSVEGANEDATAAATPADDAAEGGEDGNADGDDTDDDDTDGDETDDDDTDGGVAEDGVADGGQEDDAAEVDVEPAVYADDFSQSIAPILANNCASCHNAKGPGAVHWPLTTAQDAVDAAEFIPELVTAGVMPPWPAGDLSVEFHNDRSLRQDEIDALVAWVSAGSKLDVDPTTPIESPRGVVALADVDLSLEPVDPYDGSPDRLDDYRCVIYDPQLTEPRWLNGFNFVPDQTEVVHHAIGYHVPANGRDLADDASAADIAGGGWACFGGVGIPVDDDIFIGWAPGQDPTQYPQGSGTLMQPGDFIVIQIHYHFEVDAPVDRSRVELDFLPTDVASGGEVDEIRIAEYFAPAEIPCSANESGPLCNRAAAMERAIGLYGRQGVQADAFNAICGVTPADFADMTDGIASGSCDLPVREFGRLVSVLGHMHEIGATFRMTLNPDTPDERVLLDIPKWDFDWQYNYEPVEEIDLTIGDTVRIECSWDRSLIEPGSEPRYIFWSDGTNDEMCFASIVTREISS